MKPTRFLLATGALAALLTGTAAAGPCTTEIDAMSKLMGSRDAGAGPTTGAADRPAGQHPPTTIMGGADPSTAGSAAAAESGRPQHPPTGRMTEAVPGGTQSPPAGASPGQQHPPTGRMGQTTPGGAASPQDVQSQSRGGPTAAQQAEGERRPAADKLASAQAALDRAREHDRSGREAECMAAIGEVKQLTR
jgi:hypothetical protein